MILFGISWRLTLVTLAIVPIVAIAASIYGKYTRKISKMYQESLAQASQVAEGIQAYFSFIDLFFFERVIALIAFLF